MQKDEQLLTLAARRCILTRLAWDEVQQRTYELGVDRCVLFLQDSGEAWNGVVSISESPEGGEVQSYYQDGMKYAQTATAEDYAATIQAYSRPTNFSLCEGRKEVYSGLFATQQKKLSFGLSYRSRIGNAVDGLEYGYKIHLVYNLIAEPSSVDYSTIDDNTTPILYSWSVKSVPVYNDVVNLGIRPTAHLVIDSTTADPDRLAMLENYIYGDDINDSRFPSVVTVKNMFADWEPT